MTTPMLRPLRLGPSPRSRAPAPGGWGPALLLAALWAVVPTLPALLRGEIPGSPWTDLYPSVWGLGWFAMEQPGLPTFCRALAAPAGMPFYYSSPLHGWAGAPLVHLGGAAFAYAATLLGARFLGVAVSFGAFRAAGLGPMGALAAAGIYGAAPFFHGYAVEGIVEGTDAWTLPLWVWMTLRGRRTLGALAFAATIASSWYLGMVACLLALGWGALRRDAWWTAVGGLLLAAPLIYAFGEGMAGAAPLPADIRAAMGAHLQVRPPGLLPDENPFAITTWVGLTIPLLALPAARGRPALALGALACAALSFGIGPWYELPVLESVRFPYRWHAGTLWCLAALAGTTVDLLGRRWLAVVPVIEGLLLSPVEPILPGAPADVPALYDQVRGPLLLELPGPVALPPGQVNPSRPRARWLLYAQLHHGAASPWAPDWNGVGATAPAPWLATWASWDPVLKRDPEPPDLAGARAAGVTQVMVHRDLLRGRAKGLEAALDAAGATLQGEDGDLSLWAIP